MREAVGGSLLMYLIIPFIVIYIVFIGLIMNYASAYRAANYVVTQIETCQADMDNCNGKTLNQIQNDIKDKYHYLEPIQKCCFDVGDSSKKSSVWGSVYRVGLPVEFDMPLVGRIAVFSVKSETKTIYGVSCNRNLFPECE